MTPMIESKRFYMRPIDPAVDDLTSYLGWMRNEVSNPHIEGINPLYTEGELRRYILEKSQKEDALLLGIFTKSEAKHIGNIKYEPIDLPKKEAWLGILIGDEEWRNVQAAREVIRETMEWLNLNLGITVFLLGVSKANLAAVRSYVAVGFTIIEDEEGSSLNDTMVMKCDLLKSHRTLKSG